MRISGLDAIELCPRDLEASLRFWRDALGLEVVASSTDAARVCLALRGGPRLVLSRRTGANEPTPAGLALSLQVEDPDAMARELSTRGIVATPAVHEAGWYRRSVTDPDGVVVRLQRPSAGM